MTETKIGSTEAKSREQHETRANKKLIATRVKAKAIGKTVNIKTVKRGRRDGQTEEVR